MTLASIWAGLIVAVVVGGVLWPIERIEHWLIERTVKVLVRIVAVPIAEWLRRRRAYRSQSMPELYHGIGWGGSRRRGNRDTAES